MGEGCGTPDPVLSLTPTPQVGTVSQQGGGLVWWIWLLITISALTLVAISLVAPAPTWVSRASRHLSFWRREAARQRLRGRRGLVLVYAVVIVLVVVLGVVWGLPSFLTRYPQVEGAARHTAITNTRTGLVALLAVLGAGGGLAYTAQTYRLSREGHITDRYTKAIGQLGDDKLEIRLGGIYALERLMRNSPQDQPTIVEVLAAYVRQKTTAPLQGQAKGSRDRRVAGYRHPARPDRPDRPVEDVQAILTVLGRRTPVDTEQPIDLTGANLTRARLGGATLADARLGGATLTDADLGGANLTDAWLGEATLTGADLGGATLTGADLSGATLTGARLVRANLTGARLLLGTTLTGARLYEADLTDAWLGGANLTHAWLGEATLTGADLGGATLTGADLSGANLTGAHDLSQEQLNAANGDSETELPLGLQRPEHWLAAETSRPE